LCIRRRSFPVSREGRMTAGNPPCYVYVINGGGPELELAANAV
jgi:hypothetical protein